MRVTLPPLPASLSTGRRRVIRRLDRAIFGPCTRSYSQCGEDVIIGFALNAMRIQIETYVDIGARDPRLLSNTYLFYTRGARGTCVDPDPAMCASFARVRPRDTCLNVGVAGRSETEVPFYVMTDPAFSTFSIEEAQHRARSRDMEIECVTKVPVLSLQELIASTMSGTPNLVSMDTEGTELDILANFDFQRHRPQVFCIETLRWRPEGAYEKPALVSDLMRAHDYFFYADTYINSIFVDRHVWERSLRGS